MALPPYDPILLAKHGETYYDTHTSGLVQKYDSVLSLLEDALSRA